MPIFRRILVLIERYKVTAAATATIVAALIAVLLSGENSDAPGDRIDLSQNQGRATVHTGDGDVNNTYVDLPGFSESDFDEYEQQVAKRNPEFANELALREYWKRDGKLNTAFFREKMTYGRECYSIRTGYDTESDNCLDYIKRMSDYDHERVSLFQKQRELFDEIEERGRCLELQQSWNVLRKAGVARPLDVDC